MAAREMSASYAAANVGLAQTHSCAENASGILLSWCSFSFKSARRLLDSVSAGHGPPQTVRQEFGIYMLRMASEKEMSRAAHA